MAISVNWATRIISVPRADLTLIQLLPTEIRELNLNQFHLWLKDAEDSEEGMIFPDTHNHNTEVVLGGIVYARVVEMINGYTVTFEDGFYAVNLVGANSNVGDVVNVNSVSIRSQNSAGLISTQTMEYSSFDDCVAVDAVTGVSGTAFPSGTKLRPVNNLADALLIAGVRGISKLMFLSDFTFTAATYITNMTLIGEGMQRTTMTFQPGSIIAYCFLKEAHVTGRMTGVVGIDECHVDDFGSVGLVPSSQTIIVRQCLLDGEITLPSNYSGTLKALDCWSNTPGAAMPVLNMGGSTANLLVRNYSGDIALRNQTAATYVEMDFVSGHITLESTVTAGTFVLRGTATLNDQSTGTTIDTDGLLNREEITKASWDAVHIDTVHGVSGTEFPLGTPGAPVDNLSDAVIIAQRIEVNEFRFTGEITASSDFSDVRFVGIGSTDSSLLHFAGHRFDRTVFEHCTTDGIFDGENSEWYGCFVKNVTDISGYAAECSFTGNILIAGGETLSATWSIIEGDFTYFDLRGVAGTVLSMDVESGWVQCINAVAGSLIELNVKGGEVTLDASCTGGDYYLEGVGTLFNESAMDVKENHFVWDEPRDYHEITGSFGKVDEWAVGTGNIQQIRDAMALELTSGVVPFEGSIDKMLAVVKAVETGRNRIDASTGKLIYYDVDGVTELVRFAVYDKDGHVCTFTDARALNDVFERVPE